MPSVLRFRGIGLPRGTRRRLATALVMLSGYCLAGLVGHGRNGERAKAFGHDAEQASLQSFSAVLAAKETLQRLQLEYLHDLRERPSNEGKEKDTPRLRTDPVAIRRVEALIGEFSGTEQELSMTHFLLSALRREGQGSRWLDVYLATLYRHPTARMVHYESERARRLARDWGREDELDRAFRYRDLIPKELIDTSSVEPAPAGSIESTP
ncbi:MAG: hypothetical protein JNL97_06700 [Verrucomicrobiales bacterium]|nr:hypothetical protein [Verrucomicrobiales bacterium]